MSDRYHSYYQAGRAAGSNPSSRASVPNGGGYHPSYADDTYLVPASSRHSITAPRGYVSSSTSSGQPTTTRPYAVDHDARLHTRQRDHSRLRRSTIDSTTRAPIIVTTTQNDRSNSKLLHSTGIHNSSPVRDDYRHGESQYYALPSSTSRSRSAVRQHHLEDHSRHRDREGGLLSPHNAKSYRNSRPSVIYPSNSRHSTAAIDYGDDGYQYTNAGELVRYDLDHPTMSRSGRQDSTDRDYYHTRKSYGGNRRTGDGSRYDSENYAVAHRRHDGHGGPPPSTRGFDRISREYDSERDRERHSLPAAPNPPNPIPHTDSTGSNLDQRERRRTRPVSVNQESTYREISYRNQDDFPDYGGRVGSRDSVAEDKRPRSSYFYDDSVSNRGFGIRTDLEDAGNDRHQRVDLRRGDILHPSERCIDGSRKPPQNRPFSYGGEGKYTDTRRKDMESNGAHSLLESAGTGLGISATTAAAAAIVSDSGAGKGLQDMGSSSGDPIPEATPRMDGIGVASPEINVDEISGRHGPPSVHIPGVTGDLGEQFDNGGASLTKEDAVSASDSDDVAGGRVIRRHRPSGSFNPNDAGDLRQIKQQLAALRVQDKEEHLNPVPGDTDGRAVSSLSPKGEAPAIREARSSDESYAVGFPVSKKHARVVSPPRDKRDDKPLRGILKQPSAKFPEEANPIREGVAPHKEDKKLKEVPAGARWTKINRKVVNPEALTIGKERFEERDDFVIVLRVLSKEEIQAYAAATQVLRGM